MAKFGDTLFTKAQQPILAVDLPELPLKFRLPLGRVYTRPAGRRNFRGSSSFEESSTFIDVVLLKRRNAIAHGEDTMVALADLDMIADETIGLMRAFGDGLENRVVLQTYKAT